MSKPSKKSCPNCTGPMQALSWSGYFCRHCGAAVTQAEDGWAHILTANLSESWVRSPRTDRRLTV